jgi:nucleoside-diphosphate-sugar epimerase
VKRVLVTGATGFVGAQVLTLLRQRGFEVHAIGRQAPADSSITFHAADLLDPAGVGQALATSGATHLLHLAWYAEPGLYWRSPLNLDWVAGSLHLARRFAAAGGRRMVVAGTCAEYAWGAPLFVENETPCRPATLYGCCKDALHRLLGAFSPTVPLSLAWGRVFFLYGPGEKPGRLVSDAVNALLAGRTFPTSHGRQRRDFMHVADVAGAFAALLDSDVEGPVNIGSGTAVPVRDVLEEVARFTGGADLIAFGARALAPDEPATIEASVKRLHDDIGFRPKYDLSQGIAQTVDWWRNVAATKARC